MRTAVIIAAPLLLLTGVVLVVGAVFGRIDEFLAPFDAEPT